MNVGCLDKRSIDPGHDLHGRLHGSCTDPIEKDIDMANYRFLSPDQIKTVRYQRMSDHPILIPPLIQVSQKWVRGL